MFRASFVIIKIMTKKWKEFEQLTYNLQKQLTQDAEVVADEKIKGANSETERQIDILIKKRVAQYEIKVIIECKDYKRPVDVQKVESFVTKLKDVKANKGAIVSSKGFSKAALKLAEKYGIDTFRFVDTKSKDWNAYMSINAAVEVYVAPSFQFRVSDIIEIPISYTEQVQNLEMYSADGEVFLGTVQNVLLKKWNDLKCPLEQGQLVVRLVEKGLVGFKPNLYVATIDGLVQVERKTYFGPLPVDLVGLYNHQTGGVATKSFTTQSIEVEKLLTGRLPDWREIENIEDLAVKPFVTFMSKKDFIIKQKN